MDNNAYNLGKRRITLSTAGIVPRIDKLAEVCPVSLAISLHATNNYLRDKLVPLNKKYPIEKLLGACKNYSRATNDSHITFEYVMLKDVNDSVKEASILIKLLDGIPAKVNLIPFNPYKNSAFERSEEREINLFRDKLYKAGIITITRKTRGSDIDAACGQLVGQVEKRRKNIQNTH
jgi:23S rRNA (adenine2503-C2)-methyltransferase